MKTYCYHGRDSQGVKLFGGMLHAESWEQASERAMAGLTIKLNAGIGSHWVDSTGREVSLYLSVMPDQTERGKALTREARKVRDAEDARRAEMEREEDEDAAHEITA